VPRPWKLLAVLLPAVFPVLVVAIALGAWLTLARTQGGSAQGSIGTWLVIVGPLALWLSSVFLLARTRFYDARPAIPLSVLLLPAVGLFLLTRLPNLPQLLAATPTAWLIGVQVVRLAGGVFLLVWLSREVRQPWFNVVGGSFDLFIGATALPVAWWVASGSPVALAGGVAWNLIGLLDFVLATTVSATVRGAGPSSYLVSLHTPVVAAFRPTILGIVAFGVPLVIVVHVLSLWRLLAT
jgi:hypothetical protein